MAAKKELEETANRIGGLIIEARLSYNQAKETFDIVLERLKDVPYQSVDLGKE